MNTDFQQDVAPFPKSGLIEVLSWRTYPSLVSAMREVVSNASDADATRLNITLSRTYDQELNKEVWKLTFFDDGEGMNLDDFKNYLRLSGIGRRDRSGSDATLSGRKIIGMLGIGALAVAPWAERVEVVTKKKDNVQVLHAKIPYGKFFNNPAIRAQDLYGEQGEYQFTHRTFELRNPEASEVENGFTIIDLIGLTEEAINELVDTGQEVVDWPANGYGLLGDGYERYLASTRRGDGREAFRKFPPLLRFMHRLALLIPAPYPPDAPLRHPPIRTMVNMINAQCMDAITFQGVKLQRPMLILDQQTEEDRAHRLGTATSARSTQAASGKIIHQGVQVVINETLPKSNVQIHGYLWGQNTQIKFEDLAGVQVRIKNVGIGTYNFALFEPVEHSDTVSSRAARREAISGEIFVDYSHELEKALRGDREGFQENSAVYRELKDAVYKHIKKLYSRIDALAPSRQPKAAKSTSTPSAGSAAPGQGPGTGAPATRQQSGVASLDFGAPSVAGGGTQNGSPNGTPAIQAGSGLNSGNPADVHGSAQQADAASEGAGTTGGSLPRDSDASVVITREQTARERTYRLSFGDTVSLGLPTMAQIASVRHEEGLTIITVREDLLPAGLTGVKAQQACFAAAVSLARDAARQLGKEWSEVEAALALEPVAGELTHAD